jgi:hypothetical protein
MPITNIKSVALDVEARIQVLKRATSKNDYDIYQAISTLNTQMELMRVAINQLLNP